MLAPAVRGPKRIRHETKRREVEVVRVEPISKNMVAITFHGSALSDFNSLSFDDHVKFNFENGEGMLVRRDYTPRHFDAARNELTIEFVLHEGGEASAWARSAKLGMTAVIGGPKSSFVISKDYDQHLLVGDKTALPAIHRRIEELPPQTQALVIVHLEDEADRRHFQSEAQVMVIWAKSPDELIKSVRSFSPASEGCFIWCAGEASMMAQLRDIVLHEKHHPREEARIAAYWRMHGDGGHEVLA